MTTNEKIALAQKEIHDILIKRGLRIDFEFSFPTLNKLPSEVQLALEVVKKHGLKISFFLQPKDVPFANK